MKFEFELVLLFGWLTIGQSAVLVPNIPREVSNFSNTVAFNLRTGIVKWNQIVVIDYMSDFNKNVSARFVSKDNLFQYRYNCTSNCNKCKLEVFLFGLFFVTRTSGSLFLSRVNPSLSRCSFRFLQFHCCNVDPR